MGKTALFRRTGNAAGDCGLVAKASGLRLGDRGSFLLLEPSRSRPWSPGRTLMNSRGSLAVYQRFVRLFAWSGSWKDWVGQGNPSAAGLTAYLLEESGIARCCQGRKGEGVGASTQETREPDSFGGANDRTGSYGGGIIVRSLRCLLWSQNVLST